MIKQQKDRWNVGGYDEVTADEDPDRDAEIAEKTAIRDTDLKKAAARRRLEQLREEGKL